MMKKHLVFICLLALPFLWMSFATPAPVRGANITVTTNTDEPLSDPNNSQCSIREAIQNANNDAATEPDCPAGAGADVILFGGGTITLTTGSSISLITEIDIQGPIIFDGNNTTNIFVIAGSADVTLNQVELRNGFNTAGGAILGTSPSTTLTINQGDIHDNEATGNGGAISSDGILNINSTIFSDNTADGDGGAIYQTSGFMTIDQSAFTGNIAGNVAGGNGGAIYHAGALSEPSSITATYFSDNRALNADNFDGGGAIHHFSGILNIFASAFSGNNADGDYALGGAIFNNSTTVGGMAIEYSHFGETLSLTIPPLLTISITDPNTVTGTTNANAGGGAIFNNGNLLLLSSSIIGNTSSNHGGGFHNISSSGLFPPALGQQVIIANSTFANNTAIVNGGAIYHGNEDDLLQLVNLTIANNTAGDGGGIYNEADGESPDVSDFDEVSIVNTILASNSPNNCSGEIGGGSIGNGNLIPSGNNVVFGGACDIRQQDPSSTIASPITADPDLGLEELTFSIPSIITIAFPLGTNSSAHGNGDATLCLNFPVINLDQRALPRPQGAPLCDIGAYESSSPAPQPEMNVQGNSVTIADGEIIISLGDHTQFVATTVGTPVSRTYTIQNTGAGTLNITLPITVPAGFTVTTPPASSVAPTNGSTTFTVECTAATANTFTGTVSIGNSDSNESPYNFDISCTVAALEPEMDMLGLGNPIGDGDGVPSALNGTAFGITTVGTQIVRIFRIENNGTANLTVGAITVPTGYTVTSAPAPTVIPGDFTTFDLTCDALTDGVFPGIVEIVNNDSGENPYDFAVSCTVNPLVAVPEINVQGNSVTIADGETVISLGDHTQFVATTVGNPVSRIYTIQNTGTADLTITLPVTVPAGFTVSAPPAILVTAGGNTTFTVECTAASANTFTGTVSIGNNDSNENPYTFNITCNVTSVDPEINVQGNGIDIVIGDTTPDTTDDTDFGTTPVGIDVSRTFTIQNTGVNNLTVSITAPAAPFSITFAPTSPVAGGGSTTFTVECDATLIGGFGTTIEIINNDSDENPYTFDVACTVSPNAPEINILGNGVTINDGDVTPAIADFTDFGTTNVGIPLSRTFTIENLGVLNLTVTNPITVPAGFSVLTPPTSPILPAGNTTFTIVCDATIANTYSGTVIIANNDSNENPYEFGITCVVNVTATLADLNLTKTVSDSTPQVGDTLTYTLTLSNTGPDATTNVEVVDTLPPTVTYQVGSFAITQGSFNEGTLTWTVGTLGSPATAILTFDVVVNTSTGITINYAQVTASDITDNNSTPNNGTPPTPAEDDEAAISFLFDPPFGRKAFTEAGVNVLEWTIVWANPSNNPVVVSMSDPLLGGTTFVAGSLSCTTPGTTTITTCLHDTITNEIVFTGIIDPNPGSTPATLDSASNRLIIVYRVLVPDNVATVSNVATLTTANDDVVTVTNTYTRTITPPPTTGGGTPLTTEQIQATVTALPATGETPWWADIARGALVIVALTIIVGAGGYWRKRMTQHQ